MNTQDTFSSHLISLKPLMARATWRIVNSAKTTGMLLKPKRIFRQELMAPAPTQLWKPNQTMAGIPRMKPGILTPAKPKLCLACTVNGTPYLWP